MKGGHFLIFVFLRLKAQAPSEWEAGPLWACILGSNQGPLCRLQVVPFRAKESRAVKDTVLRIPSVQMSLGYTSDCFLPGGLLVPEGAGASLLFIGKWEENSQLSPTSMSMGYVPKEGINQLQ